MGIDSHPLLSVCWDATGVLVPHSEVQLRAAPLPEVLANRGDDVACYDGTLEGALMRARDGYDSKMWGYFTWRATTAWRALFEAVFAQNPRVDTAELHWWCSDEAMPFVIVARRAELAAAPSDSAGFAVYRGVPCCVLWTKFVPSGAAQARYPHYDEDACFTDWLDFDEAAYRAAATGTPGALWSPYIMTRLEVPPRGRIF